MLKPRTRSLGRLWCRNWQYAALVNETGRPVVGAAGVAVGQRLFDGASVGRRCATAEGNLREPTWCQSYGAFGRGLASSTMDRRLWSSSVPRSTAPPLSLIFINHVLACLVWKTEVSSWSSSAVSQM